MSKHRRNVAFMYSFVALFNITLGVTVGTWINIIVGLLFIALAGLFFSMYRSDMREQARRERRREIREWEDRNRERRWQGLDPLPHPHEVQLAATVTVQELRTGYDVD